ncbi:MAG TPA: ACT domain-containing protein [Candidatus Fournierella merdigallinarum]|nr:ACT domain-containing protein [Candidatus Fournierella merdigallinarum]
MNGISTISSEQNIMVVAFSAVRQSEGGPARYLSPFSEAGVNLDMICLSLPQGDETTLSFTTSYDNWALVMRTLPQVTAGKAGPAPLISGGYTKLTLFGQEMVGMCGVASRVMEVLAKAGVAIHLVTTSSVDISLLVAAEDEDTAIDTLRQAFSL